MIGKDGTYDLEALPNRTNIQQVINIHKIEHWYQEKQKETAHGHKQLLPLLEEISEAWSALNPTTRKLAEAFMYINSGRGTMGQELAFSQDEEAVWEDYG